MLHVHEIKKARTKNGRVQFSATSGGGTVISRFTWTGTDHTNAIFPPAQRIGGQWVGVVSISELDRKVLLDELKNYLGPQEAVEVKEEDDTSYIEPSLCPHKKVGKDGICVRCGADCRD